jgi:tetratricopeptide (TPR) repeat protein
MRLLAVAERGEPQLVVITGPAGIGKTQLAREVGARARRRGAAVAVGRCLPGADAPPLWPWRAVLRDLGLPAGLLDERPGPGGNVAGFVDVLEHLRAGGGGAPFVVVLDDVHFADPATLVLAGALLRERGLPVLSLVLCRDPAPAAAPEVLELLAELRREAVSISLPELPEEAVAAYCAAVIGPPVDPELVRALTAVTKGNPLLLREVTLEDELGVEGLQGALERAVRGALEALAPHDRRRVALGALFAPDVSPHEVALLAEVAPASAAESLAHAAERGLLRESAGGRFRFVHELARRVAASSVGVPERLDVHARAAALVRGHEPHRVELRAHHALAAASRSKEDAERAVGIARDAARSLKAVDRLEPAAALLERAAEIQAAAAPASPAAELLVERAESVLACGRLAESRPLFQHAARVAEKEGDERALARAALGLGGIWVSEHRRPDEAEGMLALQRRALERLPTTESVLRARLTARLAAEEAYRGGAVGAVLDAVEAARRTGDPRALAEALSLAHHALLTPPHTWRRLAMANELIAAGAAAGDSLFSLLGLCWRAADLLLLGSPAAGAAFEELRARADALLCRSVLFVVRAMGVMLTIRSGDFEKAEAAAEACFTLGSEVGDADALAYRGAHLSAIRVFQGREAELADVAATIAGSPTLIDERERAFASAAALFALRAGRPQPARALLQKLARDGLASLPFSSSWLPAVLAVAELAFVLDDEANAQAAYDALLPYADLPVMASLAVVCFGSVHRGLGLAALTCRKLDLAVEHFAAALAANEEFGHRPAAIQAQAELGLARLRRAGGDDPRGRSLLRDAIAAGESAGMAGLVARWRSAAETASPAVAGPEPDVALMTQGPGGRWRVVFEGLVATVPDRVGMRYLGQLLAAPGRGIPALALVVQGAADRADHRKDPMLDRKALASLRERIRELRAKAALSPAEADELTTLTRELARASGLGGRVRSFVDAPERARTAVRKSIKRAIDEISCANPALGEHLARRIETGAVCCYRLEAVRSADDA